MNEVLCADNELLGLMGLIPNPDKYDKQTINADSMTGWKEWVIQKGPIEVHGSKKHIRVIKYLSYFSDKRLIVDITFNRDTSTIVSSIICRKDILSDTDYGEDMLEEDTNELLKDVIQFALHFYEENTENTRTTVQRVSADTTSKVRKLLGL